MYIAVIVAITVMLVAATPLANFIEKNPTIVMLALGFLLMIGTTLIADGFGFHVPKGYIYAAMAFSALVEGLNMLARRRRHPATPAPAAWPTPRRAGTDRPCRAPRLGARHPLSRDRLLTACGANIAARTNKGWKSPCN